MQNAQSFRFDLNFMCTCIHVRHIRSTVINKQTTFSNVHLVNAESHCPEFHWNGQKIPKTAECEEVQVRCPVDLEGKSINSDLINHFFKGFASFTCQCDTIKWTEEPNLSECMSKSIFPLKDLALTAQEPLNVMRRFHEEIKKLVQDGQITSGDIVSI